MSKTLTELQLVSAAESVGIEIATLKAVKELEGGKSGFWTNVPGVSGEVPIINFEAQHFRAATKCKYDKIAPDISAPGLDTKFGKGEWARFQKAAKLDRNAALKATSWGLFQIMGFNYFAAGFLTVEAFVKAQHESEAEHLRAFLNFIKGDRLKALRDKNWSLFARLYNGARYKELKYDTKLAALYDKYSKAARR